MYWFDLGLLECRLIKEIRQYSNTEVITTEGDMGSRILTASQVVIDMSKLLATHSNNKMEINMASQGVMVDDSNTDKVRLHPKLAVGSRLGFLTI